MAFFILKCRYEILVNIGVRRSANFSKASPLQAHSAIRRVTNTCYFRPQFSTVSPTSSVEYRWIDGVEHLGLYKPGGYHPVAINDLLHKRYRIVEKLGFGGYSTIWLARDEIENCYVAVKVGISSTSLPQRERQILKALNVPESISQQSPADLEAAAVPIILDSFDVRGPNGTHPCYTVTPAQGDLKEASFSRLFPIQVARALAAKLATAVAFIQSRGFVHGGTSGQVPD